MFSKEYISALAIVLVGVLKLFGIEIGAEEISEAIIVVLALFAAFQRFKKGDINLGGIKKA